jgi:hypothetical protein
LLTVRGLPPQDKGVAKGQAFLIPSLAEFAGSALVAVVKEGMNSGRIAINLVRRFGAAARRPDDGDPSSGANEEDDQAQQHS